MADLPPLDDAITEITGIASAAAYELGQYHHTNNPKNLQRTLDELVLRIDRANTALQEHASKPDATIHQLHPEETA